MSKPSNWAGASISQITERNKGWAERRFERETKTWGIKGTGLYLNREINPRAKGIIADKVKLMRDAVPELKKHIDTKKLKETVNKIHKSYLEKVKRWNKSRNYF